VPREETVESFILAFKELGYEPTENRELEANYEKVALYADGHYTPTHMISQ